MKKVKVKGEGEERRSGRKIGRQDPKFSSLIMTNPDKALQLLNVVAAVGNLREELRILRQTDGITSGEKKAIGAMLDKLDKFNDYVANCLNMKGGAK